MSSTSSASSSFRLSRTLLVNACRTGRLDLHGLSLTHLPPEIAMPTPDLQCALVALDLSQNALTHLSNDAVRTWTQLRELWLDRNKLVELPYELCRLAHLRWLSMEENPDLPAPLLDVYARSRVHVTSSGVRCREAAPTLRWIAEQYEQKQYQQQYQEQPQQHRGYYPPAAVSASTGASAAASYPRARGDDAELLASSSFHAADRLAYEEKQDWGAATTAPFAPPARNPAGAGPRDAGPPHAGNPTDDERHAGQRLDYSDAKRTALNQSEIWSTNTRQAHESLLDRARQNKDSALKSSVFASIEEGGAAARSSEPPSNLPPQQQQPRQQQQQQQGGAHDPAQAPLYTIPPRRGVVAASRSVSDIFHTQVPAATGALSSSSSSSSSSTGAVHTGKRLAANRPQLSDTSNFWGTTGAAAAATTAGANTADTAVDAAGSTPARFGRRSVSRGPTGSAAAPFGTDSDARPSVSAIERASGLERDRMNRRDMLRDGSVPSLLSTAPYAVAQQHDATVGSAQPQPQPHAPHDSRDSRDSQGGAAGAAPREVYMTSPFAVMPQSAIANPRKPATAQAPASSSTALATTSSATITGSAADASARRVAGKRQVARPSYTAGQPLSQVFHAAPAAAPVTSRPQDRVAPAERGDARATSHDQGEVYGQAAAMPSRPHEYPSHERQGGYPDSYPSQSYDYGYPGNPPSSRHPHHDYYDAHAPQDYRGYPPPPQDYHGYPPHDPRYGEATAAQSQPPMSQPPGRSRAAPFGTDADVPPTPALSYADEVMSEWKRGPISQVFGGGGSAAAPSSLSSMASAPPQRLRY